MGGSRGRRLVLSSFFRLLTFLGRWPFSSVYKSSHICQVLFTSHHSDTKSSASVFIIKHCLITLGLPRESRIILLFYPMSKLNNVLSCQRNIHRD